MLNPTSFIVEHFYQTTLLNRGVRHGNQTTALRLHQERYTNAPSGKSDICSPM
jgi:hypothetical protein